MIHKVGLHLKPRLCLISQVMVISPLKDKSSQKPNDKRSFKGKERKDQGLVGLKVSLNNNMNLKVLKLLILKRKGPRLKRVTNWTHFPRKSRRSLRSSVNLQKIAMKKIRDN